jgi:acetolactate synthase-1/2/3 large subunit
MQNAGVDFQRTDFAALARVYGGIGVTVTGPGEAGRAVAEALKDEKFTIVAVEIPQRAYDGLF